MSQQENQQKSANEVIDELITTIQAQIDVLETDLIQLKRLKYDSKDDFKEWFFGNGSGAPRGFAFGGGGGSSARGYTGGGAGTRGFYGFLEGGGSHAGNGFYGMLGGFSVGNGSESDKKTEDK